MPKPPREPKLPVSVHPFEPSYDLPPDWRDVRYCGREGCGLREDHRVHTEYVAPVDDSDRITGDRDG